LYYHRSLHLGPLVLKQGVIFFLFISRLGTNCFTTLSTQLTYHFNGRTDRPLEDYSQPGYDELIVKKTVTSLSATPEPYMNVSIHTARTEYRHYPERYKISYDEFARGNGDGQKCILLSEYCCHLKYGEAQYGR